MIAVTGSPGARRRAGSRAPRGPSPPGMGCLFTVAPAFSGNDRVPLGFDHVDSARDAGRAHVEDDGAPTLTTSDHSRQGVILVCTVVRPGWVGPRTPGGPTPTDPEGAPSAR